MILFCAFSLDAQVPYLVKDMTTGPGTRNLHRSVDRCRLMIRAAHLLDLRANLDAARAALGLTALSYTDSTVTAGATIIRATHFAELRNGVK